jgi:molybdate transport system substrate-binding protein
MARRQLRGWRRAAAAVALGWLGAVPAASAAAQELLVFAAASLKDALDAAIAAYPGEAAITASYASSSVLARQIEQGAPADLYISANPEWMDYLAQRELIRAGTRAELLGNGLVLVAPAASDVTLEIAPGFDLTGALDGGRLAMGDPDHVPAGIYGKAALESLGAWQAVESQVARTDNVRAALALVARDETPLGIVYRSDALADPGVRVVGAFPEDCHPPIVYQVAVTAGGQQRAAAGLVEFLKSPAAAPLFERFGFTPRN